MKSQTGAQASLLQTAMAEAPFGVALFNDQHQLIFSNPAFHALLDLPAAVASRGIELTDLVAVMTERGEFRGRAGEEARQRALSIKAGTRLTTERGRPNGRWLRIEHVPLSGGGLALYYVDITEHVERRWRSEGLIVDLRTRVAALEENVRRLQVHSKS